MSAAVRYVRDVVDPRTKRLARALLEAHEMNERSKTVLYHVTPTVVRRRLVLDPRGAKETAAEEPPPSSIFPHPDYNLPDHDEARSQD